jgi:hypothetical protein
MGDARAMTAATAALPRTRRAYDHRLREQVVRYGAKVVAGHVQIPRSTASTWRRRGLRPVVTTEPFDQEKQHALDSSVRWEKRARALAAVVRLLVALLRASGFSLAGKRLPEGLAKAGILRAISSAEAFLPMVIGDDLRKRDLAIPSSARLFPSTFLIFLPLTALVDRAQRGRNSAPLPDRLQTGRGTYAGGHLPSLIRTTAIANRDARPEAAHATRLPKPAPPTWKG